MDRNFLISGLRLGEVRRYQFLGNEKAARIFPAKMLQIRLQTIIKNIYLYLGY